MPFDAVYRKLVISRRGVVDIIAVRNTFKGRFTTQGFSTPTYPIHFRDIRNLIKEIHL
jgi:hypothetical protein